MNKKILATLLLTSIAITGLFAADYGSKSAIISAKKPTQEYTFEITYGETSNESSVTAEGDTFLLGTTEITTGTFTIQTIANGNHGSALTFETTLTTGEFMSTTLTPDVVQGGTENGNSTFYPVIVQDVDGITLDSETLESKSFSNDYVPHYDASTTGEFTRVFKPGLHLAGSQIARFTLKFKGDDTVIAANDYKSTTTVNISSN